MDDGVFVIYNGREFDDFGQVADIIARQLDEAPDRAARQIGRDLFAHLQQVAKSLRSKHSTPWSAGTTGMDTLHKRSGKGIQSIFDSIKVKRSNKLNSVEGSISTGSMTIHETGGVITASGGGYLTIPLPAALDARGVPIYQNSRDWPNTFVQRSRKGNLIIFQKRGTAKPVPLYVLKHSVRLRPRLKMQEEFMGAIPHFEEKFIDRLVEAFDA